MLAVYQSSYSHNQAQNNLGEIYDDAKDDDYREGKIGGWWEEYLPEVVCKESIECY